MATVYSGSDSDLLFLADILRSGGLVAVPTETVYGLAANALDPVACARVFEAKGRPHHDPVIVHVASRAAAGRVASFDPDAQKLAARFWPGPLTLILPKHAIVPDIVTAGRPTVAVRVPAHPLMRALLERCDLPLAAPSANPFGGVSPTCVAHVVAGLGDRIEHVLDGGPCTVGVESTILDTRNPEDPAILRLGGITREAIEATLGRPVRVHVRPPGPATAPPGVPEGELAPGMLDRHYSPRTPLELRDGPFTPAELAAPTDGAALLCFTKPPGGRPAWSTVRWLTESGDVDQAARSLFATLHALDAAGFARIVCEPAPAHGLGPAINDRLRRAAAPPQIPRTSP